VKGLIDLVPQLCALVAIQLNGGTRQPPIGPAGDRHHHLQITRQIGDGGRRRLGFALPLGLQKQPWLFENALAAGRRSVSPGGVQLAGFAAAELVCGQCLCQAPAIRRVGARHRHQILHRHLGADGAVPHVLLHALRQQLDQGQSARHPTQAAIEAARQLFQTVTETPLQFRQQPTFFQRRGAFGHAQRTIQHQRLGLT
jgi:hypothetical protein